jgi:phosphoglycerate dehydrogenase-like enzyme
MRIAILDDYQQVAQSLADWESLQAEVFSIAEHIDDRVALAERLAGCDVVVVMRERTRVDAALLDMLPDLRLLVTTGQRNAAIDLVAAAAHGVVVSATGYISPPTAELTWALILANARNLREEFASMAAGGWQQTVGTGLEGTTLGLLGLGRLGTRVARVAQAFDMKTIAWSQNLTAERAAEHGVTAVGKDELFARSDVLSVHLILSKRTRGLVGAAELALMKPTSLLVNTSRGPIVQQDALIDALRRKVIGRAALDVFDVEPLPADHPLRSLPNALLTPHLGYVTGEQYGIFFADAVQDIRAFSEGAPIRVLQPG